MSQYDIDGYGPNDVAASVNVSRETLDKIGVMVELLEQYRSRQNLVGPKEMDHIWRRHVLDCVQLFSHIDLAKPIVDLGSGAGFPGLILASAMSGCDGSVTLIESVGKKCAFLRAVIEAANLPARVIQGRVETAPEFAASTVTARAFAPLPRLLAYAEPWLSRGAVAVLPKGRRWEEELTQAQESWKFACDVIPSQSGDGVILKMSEVSRGGQSN